MPRLLSKTGDSWTEHREEGAMAWQDAESWRAGQPLLLQGDAEPEPAYAQASAIAVEFPAFIDGRGLSLAVLLRTRLGYSGELRAVGALHEDVLHYMVRCGFDSLELPDDRNVEIALNALTPYSDQYQASVTQPEPAFRRVHRGVSA